MSHMALHAALLPRYSQQPLQKGSKLRGTSRACRLCAVPGIAALLLWFVLCGCAQWWSMKDVPFANSHRVLLVTAHPDDETIFFSPVISGLTAGGKHVYLLCLSTGNAYGLGDVRLAEVQQAAAALGVPGGQLTVLNHTMLQDGKQSKWDLDTVVSVVWEYKDRHNIDTIVTFDDLGITQHPNHLALHAGISKLIAQCHLNAEKACPQAWELVTSNKQVDSMTVADYLQLARSGPEYAGYVNHNVVRTFVAMGAHKSQFKWWRHVLLSPLTLVNSFRRITPQSWLDISDANTAVQPVLLRLPQQVQQQAAGGEIKAVHRTFTVASSRHETGEVACRRCKGYTDGSSF